MRNIVAGCLGALLVTGCAVQHDTLAKYGDYELSGDILVGYSVESVYVSGGRSVPACVASAVQNESITLSDSAGSFVGAYTGTYYQANKSREAGGGTVIQHASADGSEVVARGVTRYKAGLIERAVRFTLMTEVVGARVTYAFSNLEQAQTNTGYAANAGFHSIHARPGGGAGQVLESLKDVAAEIDQCMSGRGIE